MGRRRRRLRKTFFESEIIQSFDYRRYYNRLLEIAMTRFKFNNLPDTIDPLFFARNLTERTYMLWLYDDVLGHLVLPCSVGGSLNVYNIPKNRRVITPSGYNVRRNDKNSVLIYDNIIHDPILFDLQVYAMRMYHCDNVIDVNIDSQRTPVLLQGTEDQILTIKNRYQEYAGGAPVIVEYKDVGMEELKVLKTDSPYVADKIQVQKEKIWNDALTYLGVPNVNVTKKERMITDEVSRGMGGVDACLNCRLKSREYACEQVNKMFGLNISVEPDYSYVDTSIPQNGGADFGNTSDNTVTNDMRKPI